MQVILTEEKCIEFFYDALCNAVGNDYMDGYGLTLECDDNDFKAAKSTIKQQGKWPCLEDVWVQILKDGGELTMVDEEGDGDYTRSITLDTVYEKMPEVPTKYLLEMEEGHDDADTADVIVQTIFFGEIIFG